MSTKPAVKVALALVLASLARPGRAAELTASGPSECADTTELSFRVERSIGMSLGEAAPLAFDVVMLRSASGYVAHIGVTGAAPDATRMERTLGAADCDKLLDALSVAVALALGVGDASSALETPPDSVETATNAASPEHATRAEPAASAANAAPPEHATSAAAALPAASDEGNTEPATTASASLAPSISLWLLGDAGSLPSPSLGAALGAQLGWGKLELRMLGSLLFEQETAIDSAVAPASGAPAPGAKLQLLAGAVLACTAPFGSLRAPIAPFACVGAELGRLSGIGTGVASPRQGSALWAAPLVQVGGSWAVPDTALRLGVALTAAAPLNRDEFALRDIGTVHQPPSVVGRLAIGVGVGFD